MRIRTAMASTLMVGCFVLLALGGSCNDSDREGFDGCVLDGGGRDASQPVVKLYDWSIANTTDLNMLGAAPLATAVGPGGQIAMAYYAEPDPVIPYLCVTNLGEEDIEDVQLHLARYDGSTWTSELVETVHSPDSVAAIYDASGTLHLAYMSGPTTGTYCGVSQLFWRAIPSGGVGSPTTIAADSSTGDACRLMQNACNAGDNVGRFPSIANLADGRMLLAYQDTHYNFGQQTDIEGSDLEVAIGTPPLSGGDRQCLDDSSGAGHFSVAFAGQGGRGGIATWSPVTHHFNSSGCLDNPPVEEGSPYSWLRGIYLVQEGEEGDWTNTHIADIIVDQRLAAAYTEADGYVIAYNLGGQLAAYHSAEGTSFQNRIVDQAGRNAVSPSAGVDSEGRIVIAYARCSQSPGSSCSAAQDGVRLAALVEGRWHTEDVVNDVDSLDGVDVRLHFDPDTGNPVILYRNATSRRIMVARGTPRP